MLSSMVVSAKKLYHSMILIMLPLLIFRHQIIGNLTWIGNPDRLNSHLKVLKFYSEGLASGRLNAWNEYEMMGYDSFTLPYTFPNILTFINHWLGVDNLYITAGYISIFLLILAGISAYYFINNLVQKKEFSLVGAICYQFSSLTILKVSQNDMSFAVFIIIPLLGIIIQRVKNINVSLNFICLASLIFLLLNFMFLQKVSYALFFIGTYALYRSILNRDWTPIFVLSLAFVTALMAAFPRIYGIVLALPQYARAVIDTHDLKIFADSYDWHHILPSEILRWFDDTIFGHYASQTALINSINMTEGFLLYTSAFVPFLILYGLFRYNGKWLMLPRSKINDVGYLFWFLIFTFGVIFFKPLQHLIFICYQRMDFTHARILIVGLLPLATLVSLILLDTYPRVTMTRTFIQMTITTILSAILAAIIVGGIELLANQGVGFTQWPPYFLQKINASLLNFRYLKLSNEALIRILLSGIAFLLILYQVQIRHGRWQLRHKTNEPSLAAIKRIIGRTEWVKLFLHQALCFCIVFQILINANFQVNNHHTTDKSAAFASGNFHYSSRDDFMPPTNIDKNYLQDILENRDFRTILICDPIIAGGFCAGHVPGFWNLRTIDGYYGIGVPLRLAALPWYENVSLRTISFQNSSDLPWKVLSLLNVKYALLVNPTIYRNTLRSAKQGGALKSEDLSIIKNPEAVVPRIFFTSSVIPVKDIKTAVDHLFQKNNLIDVTKESVVEGIKKTQQYISTGNIILDGKGDDLEIVVEKYSEDRFIILNDLYFPGWTAKIDGKYVPIFPANVSSRGLVVPAGADKIFLHYTPFVRSKTAMYFYWSSILLFIGIILYFNYSKRKIFRQKAIYGNT